MKVNFIRQEKKDNKTDFSDLKAGDIFSLADPKNVKAEIYMKVSKPKGDTSSFDTVILESGKLANLYDLKREAITQDQMYVYKLEAEIQIKID
jgi:hypothetical protein